MLDLNLKNFIINHAKNSFPKECCGFIIENKDNILECISLENISNKKDHFIINPIDYLNIKNNFNIKYMYHSHEYEENFSILDIECAKHLMLDLIVFIINKNIFKIYNYKTGEIFYG